MSAQRLEYFFPLIHQVAMTGSDLLEAVGKQLVDRVQVVAHVAVRRKNNRGDAFEHMISGEQQPLRRQKIAYAIRGMARRVDCGQFKIAEDEALAIRRPALLRVGFVSPPLSRRRE